jgi:ABC-type uncharacterized transport system permease subunit
MYLVWLRAAVVLYGIASLAAIPAVLGGQSSWKRFCVPAALSAWLLELVGLVEMLTAHHHWIPSGAHEVQTALALLVTSIFLIVWFVYRTFSFAVFALPLSLLLTFIPALSDQRYTFSSEHIRSGWIFAHVFLLLAAYVALFFSVIASILYHVEEQRLKSKRPRRIMEWLPPLDTMDRISQSTLIAGFVCMTIGLFAGSLVAQERVGPSYFADPKVLMAFALWVLYVLMIYVRRSTGFRGRRAVYLSSLIFIAMIGVWAANLVSSVHRFSLP